ncbi:MAG: tetratricopeptide repeat protein [Candidatus Latescibacteria bacterium]|nr:tetratricopeptide repeat protein [Candidatus Latescibacterota bacterium]
MTIGIIMPPEVDMSGYRRVAIANFQGMDGSGELAAHLLVSRIFESKAFDIVERQRMESILNEHSLTMSGVIDDSTAKQVGAILGVDALIFGEVTTYEVEDQRGIEKVKEQVWTGEYEKNEKGEYIYEKTLFGKQQKKKVYKEVFVDQPFIVRSGSVSVNFRVVDVLTGRILAVKSNASSYHDQASGTDEIGDLSPKGEILNNLIVKVVEKFVKQIAPYHVRVTREFEKESKRSERGVRLARLGLWEEAVEIFEKERDIKQSEAYVHYNLGIAYEAMGKLDVAEEAYKQAVALEPKERYLKALLEVKKGRGKK